MPEQADTVIGASVELKGSLHNSGPIHIYGKVTGDVSSDSLIVVGESAVIQGPVTAKQVDIAGQVHGSVTADEQIELQPKSLVKGDLTTGRLSIKPGAVFIGKSQMADQAAGSPDAEKKEEPKEESDAAKKRPRLEVE